ncbi:hypothetical protein BX600DRAFT_198830 [Xylariales sp. PMI_506]|nr:hypothetical protein BX600DRAFT_198830 [Xylariales sp. PMI_506]
MNHDPAPTSPPADVDNESSHRRRHDEDSASSSPENAEQEQSGSATDARQEQSQLSPKAKHGLSKKLSFLTHLLLSLDTLIYAEFCTLYYMECSFFRLIIRWIPHWLFLSVKADHVILPLPNHPVGAIIGPNLFCIFLHIVTSLPTASEASRGYLHGGVLIDFVGQKAPTSKLSLLLMDLVVLGLQCFMLSVTLEKDRVKKIINPPRQPSSGEGAAEQAAISTRNGQDHDAEERGVLRDAPAIDGADGIELQPLGGANGNAEERAPLLDRAPEPNNGYELLGEVLSSGNAVVADLHVRQSLQTAWRDRGATPERAAAYALQNVSYNATLAALAAQRRTRLQAGGQATGR